MDTDDLQQLIDRELKALPTPGAPGSLLPRVLAATVRRRPAPWYARPWLAWPHRWQIASVALLVSLGVALATAMTSVGPRILMQVGQPLPLGSTGVAPIFTWMASVADTFRQAATLMRVCWKVLVEPMAFWLVVLAVSLSLACAALWSALERAALGGASQQ